MVHTPARVPASRGHWIGVARPELLDVISVANLQRQWPCNNFEALYNNQIYQTREFEPGAQYSLCEDHVAGLCGPGANDNTRLLDASRCIDAQSAFAPLRTCLFITQEGHRHEPKSTVPKADVCAPLMPDLNRSGNRDLTKIRCLLREMWHW